MANEPFVWGAAGEKLSPKQAAERQKIAQALMAKGADFSPAGHWTEALGRAFNGWAGGKQAFGAREAEKSGMSGARSKYEAAFGGGGANPVAAALAGGGGGSSAFPSSLIGSESGGNWNALNSEGYGGRLQFGADRLADAARAGVIPAGMTGADFSRLSPEEQMAVENWHFADIERQAANMGLEQYIGQTIGGVPIDMNAIKGMAHLGGIGGAAKFLKSGGAYNPADSNGTSLSAYGNRHGGGMAPATSSQEIYGMMADPWAQEMYGPALGAMAGNAANQENAIFQQQLAQSDPMYGLGLEKAQLELEQMRQPKVNEFDQRAQVGQQFGLQGDALTNFALTGEFGSNVKPTGTIQEYEYYANGAAQRGEQPMPFEQYQAVIARAGSGASDGVGTVPAGYRLIKDPLTGQVTGMEPIPGGPAELEAEKGTAALAAREQNAANAAGIVLQDIDKAIDATSGWTAGLGGSLFGSLPGTDATDLRATIDTVKANIGFDRLQQMRDSSPTGGALGGIAVQELQMLQAVLGSLDQSQSPEQLKANLQRLKDVYAPIAAKAAAYPNAGEFGFSGQQSAGPSAPVRKRYNPATGAFE